MTIIQLRLIDPASLEDDDSWADSCTHCGTLDNHGELICPRCDD